MCPTYVTGIVDVLAKNACDSDGHSRFVSSKQRKDIWWADVVRYARHACKKEIGLQKSSKLPSSTGT